MTEIEKSKTSLEKRSLLAAKRFLERKGFEILATEYRCNAGTVDIVALNPEDSIVSFVDVSSQIKALPDESIDRGDRSTREKVAMAFLAESTDLFDESDFAVRFDAIALAVLAGDRAMLQYHTNVLAAEKGDEHVGPCTHEEARKWAKALSLPDSRGTDLAALLEEEISRRAEAEGWHCEWEQYLDEAQAQMAS